MATDQIQNIISKGYSALGTVQQVQDAVGEFLPANINDSLNSLFGRKREDTSVRSVSDFASFLSKKNGLARTNRFYITIQKEGGGNHVLGNSPVITGNPNPLSFLAESASLPGVGLATSEVRRYGYGATERMPTFPIFVDTNISFLGDNTGEIHSFFYKWMNGIIAYDSLHGTSSKSGAPGSRPFEVSYKKNYTCTVNIVCVDDRNKKIISVRLNKAFPIFLGDVSLSWADNDNIMRIPVTFSFFNWERDDIDVGGLLQEKGNILTNLQKVVKVANAVTTLAAVTKPNSIADVVNVVNNTKAAVSAIRNF